MTDFKDSSNQISNLIQVVSFFIANEEYGLDILNVQEIIKIVRITSIPDLREVIEGVIDLRGRVIPIIDLRSRLGLNKIGYNDHTRIIVVNLEAHTIGFIVDGVNEVLRIPAGIVEPPPDLVTGQDSKFIKSFCNLDDRILIVIDVEKVLDLSERAAINKAMLQN